MSWLHIGRQSPCAPRLDAVLARNLEAQQRSGRAADDVVHAADDQRVRIEATAAKIKERESSRIRNAQPVRTSEVRDLVEEMLRRTQDAGAGKGHRQ